MRYTRLFENLNGSTHIESKDFNQGKLIQLLAKHKAILIQRDENENPMTTNDFGNFIASFHLEKYPYVGGAAPRRIIPCDAGEDLIYTANEAPPDMLIPFHHELAQTQNPPQYLFFFCDQPSETGGETALIDSTLVYRYANDHHREFMTKLKKYGARYTRVMPPEDDPTSPQGRSFYNTYQLKTKEEVEDKLKQTDGAEYKWLPNGDLSVTSEPVPAIKFIDYQHSHAIYQWTFHNSIIAAFVGWQDSRNDRFKAVKFGNDDPMDPEILQDIADFMEQKKICYQWQKGDIFALNNRLVMHSRNSFTGLRRVYASMFGDAIVNINGSKKMSNNCLVSDPLTFGFWRLDAPEETAYQAIKNGYRRLDSACDYGNEIQTGKGIRRAISEGLVKREDLYITTKLWNTYHHSKHVSCALDKCLEDLGLDYVDEFLIHFPISMEFVPFDEKYPPEWLNSEGKMVLVKNDINATWRAMEALVETGKTRFIGLSNFNCQNIRQIKSIARIQPTRYRDFLLYITYYYYNYENAVTSHFFIMFSS